MTASFLSRQILMLYCSTYDPNFTHRASISVYGANYLKAGIRPVFLDIADPSAASEVVKVASNAATIAVHCEQGWGLDLKFGDEAQSLFDILDKPVVSHVRDHPFCPWLLPKILASPRKTALAFTDRDAVSYCEAATLSSSRLFFWEPHIYLPVVPPENQHQDQDPAMKDRSNKLLYAGTYQPAAEAKEKFLANYRDHESVFDALVEAGMDNFEEPFWRLGQSIAESHDRYESLTATPFTALLFFANQFIRHYRREAMLSRFARHPLHLIWRGPLPDIPFHDDTVVAPPTSFLELDRLLPHFRAMIMSLNNFSQSLSERMLNAMMHNVTVWCHPNAMVADHFSSETDYINLADPTLDDESIENVLNDDERLSAMAISAKSKIQNYAPEGHIQRMLTAVQDLTA